MKLHTAIESVAFAPRPADFDAAVAAAFSPADLEAASGLPARSVAGRVALKRAVRVLLADLLAIDVPLFAIRVAGGGAARPTVSLAGGSDDRAAALCGRLHVSISHSRNVALGAAVAEVAP